MKKYTVQTSEFSSVKNHHLQTKFSMLIWSSSFIWSHSTQEQNTCKVQTRTSCYFSSF